MMSISSILTLALGVTALASSGGWWANVCDTSVHYTYSYENRSDCVVAGAKTEWGGVSGKWVTAQVIKYNSDNKGVDRSWDRGANWAYARANSTGAVKAWFHHSVQPYDESYHIWQDSYYRSN